MGKLIQFDLDFMSLLTDSFIEDTFLYLNGDCMTPMASVTIKQKEMNREFFLGFIRLHILYHAEKEDIYGQEMIEELSNHGYNVSPGTMYPTLHKLELAGYLEKTERNVDGRIRKYYHITRKGRGFLKIAKRRLRELVRELLHDIVPE